MTAANSRVSVYPIDAMFLGRWSPRAFSAEPITEADLLTMLEAASWAPSSYNVQPWRFAYARRDTPHWQTFLGLLVPGNQAWAKQAAALVFLISNSLTRPPGGEQDVPSYTHTLDAGTASGYLAMQAHQMGWFSHGMVGIDRERVASELAVPPSFRVEAAYAIGRIGDPATLPEALRAREQPNARRPLAELAFEGPFRL